MAKNPVIWTETAIKQRREILKYWTLRNKSTLYAEKLLKLIREHINLIIENPEAGKPTSYHHTREAAMGNCSIYYKLTSKHIIITAFWDNRQDPERNISLIK